MGGLKSPPIAPVVDGCHLVVMYHLTVASATAGDLNGHRPTLRGEGLWPFALTVTIWIVTARGSGLRLGNWKDKVQHNAQRLQKIVATFLRPARPFRRQRC